MGKQRFKTKKARIDPVAKLAATILPPEQCACARGKAVAEDLVWRLRLEANAADVLKHPRISAVMREAADYVTAIATKAEGPA